MRTRTWHKGQIVQCIGAVVDIQFPRDAMPKIYDALMLEDTGDALAEKGLTFEVQQQLGDGVVRTIAMGSSDGLRRGMTVRNTGAPISVPVGPGALGRIMDVLGRPIDERGPIADRRAPRDPPAGAEVRRALAVGRTARDRHQGDRPDLPVRQGRQDRPVRRRRRRQDREHAGADQQHRQGALRRLSVFAGVGERTREGNDFYHEMSEAKVIVQEDLLESRWRWCSAR